MVQPNNATNLLIDSYSLEISKLVKSVEIILVQRIYDLCTDFSTT